VAEEIIIDRLADKQAKYQSLLPQIEALIAGERNLVANMANMAAALKETFGFFWVGFYLVDADTLVLGPFQGPVACTRIGAGKGVCGAVWVNKKTAVVADVNEFPGHIACSSGSKSEIVVPGINDLGVVKYVLDIDSDQLNDFDETDQFYLEKLIDFLG
jgi:L-methionine (R)-S-oxide reductase